MTLKCRLTLKGGYLDFPHLTEIKNIHITEMYIKKKKKKKKQYKSSITKKYTIRKEKSCVAS